MKKIVSKNNAVSKPTKPDISRGLRERFNKAKITKQELVTFLSSNGYPSHAITGKVKDLPAKLVEKLLSKTKGKTTERKSRSESSHNRAKARQITTKSAKNDTIKAAGSTVITPSILDKIAWLAKGTEDSIVHRMIDDLLNRCIDDAAYLIELVAEDKASTPKAAKEIAKRLNGHAKARGSCHRLAVDGCAFRCFISNQPA